MDDLWTHSFCLACDKQVHSSTEAYCSESCKLADFDKNSTPSSQASSPGAAPPSYPWTSKSNAAGMYLSPAYDFSNAKPYGTSSKSTKSLTPSSSHSSLCSMQSTSTTGDMNVLSDKARKELRAYAVSFDPVRMQRRRSY